MAPATSKLNHVLTGIDNWNDWYPDFKADARADDTWSLFDGTEKISPKPDEHQFRARLSAELSAFDAKHNSSTLMPEPNEPAAVHQFFARNATLYELTKNYSRCKSEDDCLRAFKEKQHDWKLQNARARRANKMLYDRIHPSMRAAIEDILDPAKAFRHLQLKFKTPIYLTIRIARDRISALTLTKCSNMAAYLNEMRQNAADLSRLGQGITSTDHIAEIIKGLLPAYNDWVKSYREMLYIFRLPALPIEVVEAQLIAKEHMLSQTLRTTTKGKKKVQFID